MYRKFRWYFKVTAMITILIIIIASQSENIKSDGVDPPPQYSAILEDVTLYLYSVLSVSLQKEYISLDNPLISSQKNSIDNKKIADEALIEGLYLFMTNQGTKFKYIERIEKENNNIIMDINVKDPRISQFKVIYNGIYFLTIIKAAKIDFDLSSEGEEKFRKEFFITEMSEIANVIKEYIVKEINLDEKDIILFPYQINEIVCNHFILIESWPEKDRIIYNDEDYLINKNNKLTEALEKEDINYDIHGYGTEFQLLYMNFYIFFNPYKEEIKNETIENQISLLINFREIEGVISKIEREINRMEKENIEMLSNLDDNQDFYTIYANNKIMIRKSAKFLEPILDYLNHLYDIDYIIFQDSWDLEERIPQINTKLNQIERDLEVTKEIKEIRNQTRNNLIVITLTVLTLFFTLIMTVLNFFMIRRSNIKRLEILEKNQNSLLRKIEENLRKNNEIDTMNKENSLKKKIKKAQRKK